MNWTKTTPLEGVKYIVRTDKQNLFPAYWENGGWWHSSSDTEIFNVCTWILYPERQTEHEERNGDVPPEVLLKYMTRDYKKLKEVAKGESEKVIELRKLNKELTNEYNKLYAELSQLKANYADVDAGELQELRILNRSLTIMCSELKSKCHEAGIEIQELREKIKGERPLQLEVNRLRGYLKSIKHIFDIIAKMDAERTDDENQTTEEIVEQENK